ncbi:MAG: glycosyltransferase family 4 protein [Planctomycetota bacterium]
MSFPIAYLSAQFPKASETFVYREVRGLRARGWDMHTFTLRFADEQLPASLADLQATTTPVYGRGRLLPKFTRDMLTPGEATPAADRMKLAMQKAAGHRLAANLQERGIAHLHAHFAHAPATVAMYAAARIGIPWSFTGHANDLFQRRSLLRRKLQRASFVNCISEWHRAFYESVHPGGDYRIIRCGVSVDDALPRPAFSRKCVTLCRLVAKKGVDTLIQALPEGWTLTVAGDGPQRAELEGLADERVTFLGSVNNEDVPRLMAEHDVFALPCREDENGDRDGIPVVLMEAMAAGVPVISGDLPAIRELVAHDQAGLLVTGIDETTAALRKLEGSAERERLGNAGRQRVRDEFSLDANLDRIESALREAQQKAHA